MKSQNIQPTKVERPTLVHRRPRDANHNLWLNYHTWWMHYTVYHPDHTKTRHRVNLRTTSVTQARRMRDQFFIEFPDNHARS